jgi:hypothetical protein
MFIEIDAFLAMVSGRRGKACVHGRAKELELEGLGMGVHGQGSGGG